ncbi:hypothetical protein DPMN_145624 [Dreissena polymorpha]|uniref:Poly [ADP-ribose] polymerase n=1 Tax=Dreissena polymorpha TaxID=45954 RepID=A0A9D4F733_DREPO|nr:hypothetical protein DPMN_145624 [Dreissena polymorpha]
MDKMIGKSASLKRDMDATNPFMYPFLQWIITSNRSHTVKLPQDKQLPFMNTPHQFLLISSPPAKEMVFQAAKQQYDSTFAFHGSAIENWHSIIRQWLINASGTKFQVNGAAYGHGIYLSPNASTSMSYSRMMCTPKDKKSKTEGSRFLSGDNITCIAICEVVLGKNLKKNDSIWVMPNPDYVCTRFLCVYENGTAPDSSVVTTDRKIFDQLRQACVSI